MQNKITHYVKNLTAVDFVSLFWELVTLSSIFELYQDGQLSNHSFPEQASTCMLLVNN